jgi:cytochrome c peroxidase
VNRGVPGIGWRSGFHGVCGASPTLATIQLSRRWGTLFVLLVLVVGCRSRGNDRPVGALVQIVAPLGLPPVPYPEGNPPTAETIALGRRLFYDPRLSKDDTVACSTCHNPRLHFTDGQRVSLGVGGVTGVRNAPSLLNAAYSPVQFWDGRAGTLEEQAADPLVGSMEMNQPHEISVAKVRGDVSYRADFVKAFGPGDVTMVKIEKALASFERTLLSGDSAFDRYEYGGEKTAMSPAAVRGLALFTDPAKGNCAICHSIGEKYALFTDGKFHNTGAGVNGEGQFTDAGRFSQTKAAADEGAFKTPSLRNVALSAPYMHDGSLKTLEDVIGFYAGGGNSSASLDSLIQPLHLTARDRADLVEFMKALNGDMPANAGPPAKE